MWIFSIGNSSIRLEHESQDGVVQFCSLSFIKYENIVLFSVSFCSFNLKLPIPRDAKRVRLSDNSVDDVAHSRRRQWRRCERHTQNEETTKKKESKLAKHRQCVKSSTCISLDFETLRVSGASSSLEWCETCDFIFLLLGFSSLRQLDILHETNAFSSVCLARTLSFEIISLKIPITDRSIVLLNVRIRCDKNQWYRFICDRYKQFYLCPHNGTAANEKCVREKDFFNFVGKCKLSSFLFCQRACTHKTKKMKFYLMIDLLHQ